MLVGNDFLTWIQDELNRREWRNADLARRAEVSEATVSRIMSGLRNSTWDFCVGVARAFGLPENDVFRKSGLLPPAPPVSEEEEAGQILRRLPAGVRAAVMTMLRGLAGSSGQIALQRRRSADAELWQLGAGWENEEVREAIRAKARSIFEQIPPEAYDWFLRDCVRLTEQLREGKGQEEM